MIVRLAPCLLALVAFAPARAGVCESAHLDLPEPIADAVRPYVVCGMFSSGKGYMAKLPGVASPTAIPAPPGLAACGAVRAKAALEAGQELQEAMPERPAREAYIAAVLQDADRFIAASQASTAIGIDPSEKLASCNTIKAANAVDEGQL
jgi:hypothetical protein